MLDKKSIALLISLCKLLPASGFKIIELSDIMEVDTAAHLTATEVKTLLLDLVAKQYIHKKYIDDEEYCISITDMAALKVKELEMIELEKLTHSAVIKRSSSGETVVAVSRAGEEAYVKDALPTQVGQTAEEIEHVDAEVVPDKARRRKKNRKVSKLSTVDTAIESSSSTTSISIKRVAAVSMAGGFIGGAFGGGLVALIYYLITTLMP